MTDSPQIARVFPRRTKMTPTDEDVYVGEPKEPLIVYGRHYDQIHISVTFTWDIPRARQLAKKWAKFGKVKIGGPAIGKCNGKFVPGRYLAKGYVITSRGCPKKCSWCLVHKREGKIKELDIKDGWRVQDNNLLACSKGHLEAVFDMLSRQQIPASFMGGLDIDYLTDWHIELLKSIKVAAIFVSCDCPEQMPRLDKARDLLADFSIEQKRCYVLIGFEGDTLLDAENRLVQVYKKGFLPFAMRFRKPAYNFFDSFVYRDRAWNILTRKWCRPAAYRSYMKKKENPKGADEE